MKLSELMRLEEQKTGVVICLEPRHPAFFGVEDLKLQPDQYLHHGAYCVYAKNFGGIQTCASAKNNCMQLAARGRCFSGICPNGIFEQVYPIMYETELAGVLFGGHMVSERGLKEINGHIYNGPPLPGPTSERKSALHYELELMSKLIIKEIDLWREKGGTAGKRRDESYYLEHTQFFIDHHYSENVSLGDIADMLRVTPDYLGGIIIRRTRHNFRYLLNMRRVEEAKTYLRFHPKLNITAIALQCGFGDSNYFSTVFKRYTNMSPRDYRTERHS